MGGHDMISYRGLEEAVQPQFHSMRTRFIYKIMINNCKAS